jgi:Superfamily I DNA and RNA helicases
MDFDDLIMVTVNLFQAFPDMAAEYRRRFRHVLVDEYQDTNHAQYILIRELVGGSQASQSAGMTSFPRRAVRGGRRRPVDLRLPWRHHQEHHRIRA